MKVNIKKLQAGGGVGMLFSAVADPSSNAAQLAQGQSSSKNSSSDDNGIISKEVLNELRKHGLPNEVDAFEQVLASLENRIANGQRVTSSLLASVRAMANRIIKQSNYLDTAISTAKDNKSLGDVAIDQDGYIYALNEEGLLQKIAFNKFDVTKYNALSYAELAEYRRNSPDLINNADIIKNILSSIGSEKINDFIQGILSKIGESETKSEAYQSLKLMQGINPKEISNQELAALKSVAEAASQIGLDAIFKTELFRKNSNVQLAMQYIMSILPKQMRAQLLGSFIAQGGSYKDSKSYPIAVIQQASLAAANNTYHFGIDYDSLANQASGTKTSGTEKSFNSNVVETWLEGELNQDTFEFTDSGNKNKYSLTVKGTQMAQLTDTDNKKKSDLPLGEALSLSIGQFLDKDKIYIGQTKVSEGMLNNIAYASDKVGAVYMPVLENGDIDWKGFKGFSEAEEYIKINHITDLDEKREVHAGKGSYMTYDASGKLVPVRKTEKYMVTYGYTNDKYAEKDGNTLYEEVDKKEAELIIKRIYGNKTIKNLGIKEISTGWFRDLVKVPVFIKINKFATSDAYTYSGHGPRMPLLTADERAERQIYNPGSTNINGSGQMLFTE